MDDFDGTIPGRKFRTIDLMVVGFELFRDVLSAVEEAADTLETLVCQHANWLRDREVFHEQAAMELEKLIGDRE